MSARLDLLEALIQTRDATSETRIGLTGIMKASRGICSCVSFFLGNKDHNEIWELLNEGIRAWPRYSGWHSYPVEDKYNPNSPDIQFVDASMARSMWIGRYGKLRKELLDFLINYFSETNHA